LKGRSPSQEDFFEVNVTKAMAGGRYEEYSKAPLVYTLRRAMARHDEMKVVALPPVVERVRLVQAGKERKKEYEKVEGQAVARWAEFEPTYRSLVANDDAAEKYVGSHKKVLDEQILRPLELVAAGCVAGAAEVDALLPLPSVLKYLEEDKQRRIETRRSNEIGTFFYITSLCVSRRDRACARLTHPEGPCASASGGWGLPPPNPRSLPCGQLIV